MLPKLFRVNLNEPQIHEGQEAILYIYVTIWKKPARSELNEIFIRYISDTLYNKANICPSFRPIVCFVLELERFVFERATHQ